MEFKMISSAFTTLFITSQLVKNNQLKGLLMNYLKKPCFFLEFLYSFRQVWRLALAKTMLWTAMEASYAHSSVNTS